jgi:hypothetical protein
LASRICQDRYKHTCIWSHKSIYKVVQIDKTPCHKTNGFIKVNSSFLVLQFLWRAYWPHTSFSRAPKHAVQARTSLSYARRVIHWYLEAHRWLHLYDFAQYYRTHTIAHTEFRVLAHDQCTFLTTPTYSLTLSLSHTQSYVVPLSLSVYFQVFDTISSFFDVYKVETIGDAYMIAGGITGNIRYTSTSLHAHMLKMHFLTAYSLYARQARQVVSQKNDIFMILIAVFIFNFRAAIMRQQPPTWHLQCMQVLCACVYTRESWCARSSLMWACVFLFFTPWIPRNSTLGARECFQHLRTRF